ncbi:MAG: WD40 repeat domain-containing protein [Capsulimonadaceae bacterium]|nr:WD40 repeat domain-containing protein [Capsulimonadaceae bacterium]
MLTQPARHPAPLLAFLAIAAGLLLAVPAAGQTTGGVKPGFSLVWRRPSPPLRALDISPQGARVALLTTDGKIAIWDAPSAKPLWSKFGVTGANVALSDGVGYAFVYDALNPLNENVTFFDAATGRVVATKRLDGAIWGMSVSNSGDFMAVGTGEDSLYIYSLDVYPSYHRVRLRGVCNGLDFAPDGSYIAVGLWNASGVDYYDTSGKQIASIPGNTLKRFEPFVSDDSKLVLALQYANHQKRDPVLTLWRRDGSRVWSHGFGDNVSGVRALTSKGGEFTIASFYKQIVRDRVWTAERRLCLLDQTGQEAYQIGGLYLSLTLVCLSPDDSGFVAYDGDRSLYRFDRSGNAIKTWPLTAPIRAWAVTRDRRYLVLHTTDNQLMLLELR